MARLLGAIGMATLICAGPMTRASDAIRPDGAQHAVLSPIPQYAAVQEHYYDPATGEHGLLVRADGDESMLVYSNTGGSMILAPGSGKPIADDITTVAYGGCDLSAYEIMIGVQDSDGTGEPYTVDFVLYDACPGAEPPGQPIPGTGGTMTFDDDGLLHLMRVDLQGSEVPVAHRFWVGVTFTGNANAGWVTGALPDWGYTDNVYDFPHPRLRCVAQIGGGGIYAGFYVEAYCIGDPRLEFAAYENVRLELPYFAPGAQQWIVDDIRLAVDECELSSLEVGLWGQTGTFTVEVELWSECWPQGLFEGTQRVYQGRGDNAAELVRFEFVDEQGHGVPLGESVLLAYRFNKSGVGPILAGEPMIGESEDVFALWDLCQDMSDPPDGIPECCDECCWFWFGGNPYAAFSATIHCVGEPPPPGACCDLSVDAGEWVCRETMSWECEGGLTRFAPGASCSDPDIFDPPCGAGACCWWWGMCSDLDEGRCGALDAIWHLGHFCNDDDFRCVDHSRCLLAGWNRSCCELVCAVDPYCCDFEWDALCEPAANDLCCAAEVATWVEPPDGVVDARQPRALYDPPDLEGIDTIRVRAADGDDPKCWEVCEPDREGVEPNAIKWVTDAGGGAFTITLERPITPGAVTTISYAGNRSTGRFIAHPGNADGIGEAGPDDIFALIEFLDGTGSLPWGLYSCDLDRSTECGPGDVLRLIDVLNGAGALDPWIGTTLPDDPEICP